MAADDDAAELCRRLRPELVGALTLYCGDRHVAEDLAQQTLARVWASWGTVRQVADRRAYVHRMALNAARSQFRRRAAERRARQRLDDPLPRETDQTDVWRSATPSLPFPHGSARRSCCATSPTCRCATRPSSWDAPRGPSRR
jgi:DNA-directed RNA polymerase specialized sigma24 family protein